MRSTILLKLQFSPRFFDVLAPLAVLATVASAAPVLAAQPPATVLASNVIVAHPPAHPLKLSTPSLPPTPPTFMLRTQVSVTIKDPAEFHVYQTASSQRDPKAKARALEGYLQAYPQSVAKNAVLDELTDVYVDSHDSYHALSAASRQLQLDPVNLKAIFISVYIKKRQCAETSNAKICDEAAALAQRGLKVAKTADTSDEDWKKRTAEVYPILHSAIALDDISFRKDVKTGISEYRTELMLYPPDQTKDNPGLWDTLQLADAYTRPDAKDLVQAVWFYARAWNFAPAILKTPIEKKMEYYYTQYHGKLDGLNEIKTQTKASLFPPGTVLSTSADAPPEPELPQWPANEKAAQATVTWDSEGLRIEAANSSLGQILNDVATETGAKVEGLQADQRVFGVYGPGPARDVLSELLQGSGYNVIMVGDQGQGTPRQIVLTARSGATTSPAANPTASAANDEDADVLEEQPQPMPMPPSRAGFGPGGQMRTPQQLSEEMQRQQEMRRQQQMQQPPNSPN
ncbi:MAG: hypothetical protein ABSE51_09585 [Terracidiphilus sp.]|jgi:hypothetical protein